MRNTNSQREGIMIRVSASQQAPRSHVSHAESGGRFIRSNAGADCRVAGRTAESTAYESNLPADSGSEIPMKPSFR